MMHWLLCLFILIVSTARSVSKEHSAISTFVTWNWTISADAPLRNGFLPGFQSGRRPRSAGAWHGEVGTSDEKTFIERQFEAYYQCIKRKNRLYETMKTVGEIVLIQEGQRLELSCDLCLRPDQDIADYVVRWKRALIPSGREGFVNADGEKFQVSDDILVIHNIALEDAGHYYCEKNGGLEVMYVVDIVLVETHREVYEQATAGESRAAVDNVLPGRNIKLTTKWSSWSECDKCGRGGKRRRVGICTVRKNDLLKPTRPLPTASLDKFESGVPCRSSLLPVHLRALNKIASRESEIMIGKCFTPCPTFATQNVTDSAGKVIDAIKIEEKYFDVGSAKPTYLPKVSRSSLYETEGVDIVLKCPHKSKKNILVRWQNGTNLINPVMVKKVTNGRVKIDIHGHLHIKRLQFTDAQTMSCWVQGRLAATIKLVIVGAQDTSVKDYVVYAGCGLVGLTILVIGIGVFVNRNKKTLR